VTTKIDPSELKVALESAGASWIIGWHGHEERTHLDEMCADLTEFVEEYQRRFREPPDPLGLLRRNPVKGMAFFQLDTFRVSLEMKIMIWRILVGCRVESVRFEYAVSHPFRVEVQLRTPDGTVEGPYIGARPQDFRVLRHFGAIEVNGDVQLDGYYALRAAN
jgi:hypothetical protein